MAHTRLFAAAVALLGCGTDMLDTPPPAPGHARWPATDAGPMAATMDGAPVDGAGGLSDAGSHEPRADGGRVEPTTDARVVTQPAALPFVCPEGDWAEQAVNVGEVTLNVACQGAGRLALLLHGYPESHLAWNALAAGLAAAGYVVVAPDLRGYNLSDKPTAGDAYLLERSLRDLATLLTITGRSDALVVGHDWGGCLGFLLASRHGPRVRTLVVMNGPHPDIWGDPELDPVQAEASAGYVPLLSGPLANLSMPYIESLLAPHLSADELVAYRLGWNQPGALPAMHRWYSTNLYPQVRLPRDVRVEVPTLAIWGLDDTFVTPSQLAHLPDYVADLEVLELPGVDHWITHQRTDTILRAILAKDAP